jgi:hypothetical protein
MPGNNRNIRTRLIFEPLVASDSLLMVPSTSHSTTYSHSLLTVPNTSHNTTITTIRDSYLKPQLLANATQNRSSQRIQFMTNIYLQ